MKTALVFFIVLSIALGVALNKAIDTIIELVETNSIQAFDQNDQLVPLKNIYPPRAYDALSRAAVLVGKRFPE